MFLQKGSQSVFIPAGKAAQTLRPWCEPLIICTNLIYIHIYFKDVHGRSDVASQQVKPLSATASHIGVQQHPRLGCHNQPAPLPVQVPTVVLGKVTENGSSNWTPATQKGDLDVGTGT